MTSFSNVIRNTKVQTSAAAAASIFALRYGVGVSIIPSAVVVATLATVPMACKFATNESTYRESRKYDEDVANLQRAVNVEDYAHDYKEKTFIRDGGSVSHLVPAPGVQEVRNEDGDIIVHAVDAILPPGITLTDDETGFEDWRRPAGPDEVAFVGDVNNSSEDSRVGIYVQWKTSQGRLTFLGRVVCKVKLMLGELQDTPSDRKVVEKCVRDIFKDHGYNRKCAHVDMKICVELFYNKSDDELEADQMIKNLNFGHKTTPFIDRLPRVLHDYLPAFLFTDRDRRAKSTS